MNTILVAIDASTQRTGLSRFSNGQYVDNVLIDLKGEKNTEKRINMMIKEIVKQLQVWKPDIVFIEDDWSAANVQTTKMLSEVIGSVRTWCVIKEKEFNKMLPSTWRKLCGMEIGKKKRAELKEMSVKYVKDNFDVECGDDVADSICLGSAAIFYYQNLD